MLLPQGKIFNMLRRRLDSAGIIPKEHKIHLILKPTIKNPVSIDELFEEYKPVYGLKWYKLIVSFIINEILSSLLQITPHRELHQRKPPHLQTVQILLPSHQATENSHSIRQRNQTRGPLIEPGGERTAHHPNSLSILRPRKSLFRAEADSIGWLGCHSFFHLCWLRPQVELKLMNMISMPFFNNTHL